MMIGWIRELLQECVNIFSVIFHWVYGSALGNLIGFSSIVIGFYFYFISIKRLVYTIDSKEIINPELKSVENLEFSFHGIKISTLYISNIIIYNNGRKSINLEDFNNLSIKPIEGRIFDIIKLDGHINSECKLIENNICIELDKFDSKDFIALRIFHDSKITVDGRLKESGELMNTESKAWFYFNNILIFILVIIFFVSAFTIQLSDPKSVSRFLIVGISTILLGKILRWVHSKFFIPDKITNKYLSNQKSKKKR